MEELIGIVQSIIPEVDLKSETRLITSGIVNSLSFVTLFTTISEHYRINIPIEEIVPENFDSVDSIWALINRLVK